MIKNSIFEKKYCLKVNSLNSIEVKKIEKKLKTNSFCIVKNVINKRDIKYLLNLFKKRFKIHKEIRKSGPWIYKMKDFRRLDLGDSYKNSRFSRCITFCEWNKNNEKFYKIVKPIINLRNILSKVRKDGYEYKKLDLFEKKKFKNLIYCEFIRMLQYPTGGGFLEAHDDYEKNYPKKIMNAILIVTSKSKNKKLNSLETYKTGGLYFIKKKDKKINVENNVRSGDLVLFDQKIIHGVNSVDPNNFIKLDQMNGRISLAFSIGKFQHN